MKDQTNFSFSSEANLLLASDRMNDIESQIKAFKSKKLVYLCVSVFENFY